MSGAFQYRPKFVDIRVRPPSKDEDAREADVNALKAGERRCDHPGCLSVATARSPKSREMVNQYYWFCQPHAAQYNKGWDFFAGMTDEAVQRAQESRQTGDRPTWSFKASNRSREAAAAAAKGQADWADPFGLFNKNPGAQPQPAPGRSIGRIERGALADLDLPDEATGPQIRARYTELVKRCHPDSNGGDRSAEHKLHRVLKAWKTLQKAKMV